MTIRELLLYPLSLLYRGGTILHRRRSRPARFDIPIITVGGISAGGSGKTPVVRELIKLLQNKYFIILLTRGYGRSSSEEVLWKGGTQLPAVSTIGDEPLLLGKSLRNGVIGVNNNRATMLRSILGKYPDLHSPMVILDDGFQHHSILSNYTIVLLDDYSASQKYLLPAGYLREPHSALQRADVILVTSTMGEEIAQREGGTKPQILHIEFTTDTPYQWKSGLQLPREGKQATLVTGIARSERVVKALQEEQISINNHLKYRDHHSYSQTDVQHIVRTMKKHNASVLITTEKDAVKLEQFPELEDLLYVLPLNVSFKEEQLLLNSITHMYSLKTG